MNLSHKKIAIIATDLFEYVELAEPRAALEKAGAIVQVIAPHDGTIQGVNHDTKAATVAVDLALATAKPSDYDAVLLPGGAMNADALRVIPEAQAFVKAIEADGKPLAVICHGAWLLIEAGLVEGRRLTSYHTIATDLKNAGADWIDAAVVNDDNWVSSRQPDDIPAFNQAMIRRFSGVEPA